jgi:hypothetical protein
MECARVTPLDERGLMPLTAARGWLAGRTVYAKGDGEMIGGRFVLESDRTWAALVSLENAEEFHAYARNLRWEFHVRGRDNVSLFERYGDGVLPWIADRVDARGVLRNVPWCVLPCLLASAHPDAFDIAARVRAVDPGHRPGGTAVLRRWVVRHPDPGYRLLGERALALDDRTAVVALRDLHDVDPRGTRRRLVDAFDEATVAGLYDHLGLRVPALPEPVAAALRAAPTVDLPASRPLPVAEIDAALDDGTGPAGDNANIFCAAMRLTGFVNPGGTDGVVFQTLVDDPSGGGVFLEFHHFGFDGHALATRWYEIHDHDHDATDRETRDRLFLTPEQLHRTLGLPGGAQALFVLDDWHHPPVGGKVADSVDLVLAVEALRERRAITGSLTGKTRDQHLRERPG